MRKAVLPAVVLLALAGCAKETGGDGVATAGGIGPTASAAAAADKGDALKFAQCMREHGLSWFSDPEPGQRGVRIQIPKGQDRSKVDAAMQACKQHLPNGGEPPKLDAATLEQMRQMAKCMRENGVPNFPDPAADGGIMLDSRKLGNGPGDPDFDAAEAACARLRPSPPPGGEGPSTNRETDS